ncbi:MAG: PEP-CTERM sorting domain-containing protein [Alphaproteobacteria bacterium]|nr:PEP-CTERM sorting domain-containing protein [Alphaproteobacteria bacterium]MBN9571002.1 PEP-CTERM sorting domain-containing protein [Alphaproteobacteria bacterium]
MSVQMLRVFAIRFLAGVAAALAVAGASQADTIVQDAPFSISGNNASMLFAAFDQTLGRLDKVHVSITGQFSFDMRLAPGQTVAPVVAFNAFSLSGRGFDFSNDVLLYLPQAANTDVCGPDDPCASIIVPFVATFSLSFDLTALSDPSGVVFADTDSGAGITQAIIDATRADFITDIAPFPIYEAMTFRPSVFAPLGGYTGGGVLEAAYYYTSSASAGAPGEGGTMGGGTAISEPATVALFAIAPGLMLLRRRRCSRARAA